MRRIARYIAHDSPSRAEVMVGRIGSAVERLREFPESGRIVPEYADTNLREVIVAPYRVVYRYNADAGLVQILGVTHGSRAEPVARRSLLTRSYMQPEGCMNRAPPVALS